MAGNEEADSLVRAKMMKSQGGVWVCVECSYEADVNKLYKHVETNHVNVTFFCNYCSKPCKNRSTLLTHKSRYHRATRIQMSNNQ